RTDCFIAVQIAVALVQYLVNSIQCYKEKIIIWLDSSNGTTSCPLCLLVTMLNYTYLSVSIVQTALIRNNADQRYIKQLPHSLRQKMHPIEQNSEAE
ncbi:MAG: hypothetical protein RR068_19075, partial [Hafnia sp.]